MSPGEVLDKHTSRELTEWMAFISLEPIGYTRGDLQAAIVASTIANVNRKKGAKPFGPQDFMPQFDEREKEEQSPEDILKAAEMLNAAFGGEDKRNAGGG
jgi:hypothetical protein